MIKHLYRYNDLGSPAFFFEFAKLFQDKKLKSDDIYTLLYNKTIDGIGDITGCLKLSVFIGFLELSNGCFQLNSDLYSFQSSNKKSLFFQKFVDLLLNRLSDDAEFLKIISYENLSYDDTQQSFLLKKSSFGFKYSSLMRLLVSFDVLIPLSEENLSYLIINNNHRRVLEFINQKKHNFRRISPEQLDESLAIKKEFGIEAERFVLNFETKRLGGMDIEWVAEYAVNEGYDIASFNKASSSRFNRFIEVKSYSGNTEYFYWSKNEVMVSKIKQDKYWLYLINRDHIHRKDYKPRMIQNPYKSIFQTDNEWTKKSQLWKFERKNDS
jgi:hypothetical protein